MIAQNPTQTVTHNSTSHMCPNLFISFPSQPVTVPLQATPSLQHPNSAPPLVLSEDARADLPSTPGNPCLISSFAFILWFPWFYFPFGYTNISWSCFASKFAFINHSESPTHGCQSQSRLASAHTHFMCWNRKPLNSQNDDTVHE